MDLAELKKDPIRFLETFFLLKSEDDEPISLDPWQVKFLRDLFSEEKPISLAIMSATKGVGKSTLAAGIALYVLFTWKNAEVYFISNSREQTISLAFKTLAHACETHSSLQAATAVYKSGKVVVNSTGAIAECLPTKAKTVAGKLPSLVVWDEAHGLADTDESLWAEMTGKPSKRCISLVCSYAGIEGESPLLRRLYDTAISEDKPDKWLFFWSHDPFISSKVTQEYLDEKRKEHLPHQYVRLFENRWVSASGSFITREQWDQCLDPNLRPIPPGSSDLMFLGLDCGLRRDSAILTGILKTENQYHLAHFRCWLPGRGKKNEIELEGIYNHLLNLHQTYNIAGCWFDPRFLSSIAQRLRAKGVNMIEVSQQPSSISRCYENLYQVLTGRRFTHWGEPTLTKHMMNCVASAGPAGIMLEKGGTRSHKIDGAVSLALACFGGSKHVETTIRVHRASSQPRPPVVTPTSPNWTRLHKPIRRRRAGEMGSAISDIIKEASNK